MQIGIRFSSPLPEKIDLEKFDELFLNNASQIEELLNNAPYEISILTYLFERIENKLL